ncbi:hypothetical protein TRVL_00419 [Trypanosoma vivax]|uniref:Uncharacterized protein n=1 Tax=Trypanosoma vivax (strain Y486) TaxID=1055687 RepID=G0U7U2_TRYVY|nr:hypothetical protein TRVL_00419 [Trypanosoma vivax]CCC51950.1 hypothetical protein, unlikely [Trypanosoma vivax Y486]
MCTSQLGGYRNGMYIVRAETQKAKWACSHTTAHKVTNEMKGCHNKGEKNTEKSNQNKSYIVVEKRDVNETSTFIGFSRLLKTAEADNKRETDCGVSTVRHALLRVTHALRKHRREKS